MNRNYTAIHYILEKLDGFNPKFVNCVIRCFNAIEQYKEPNGCLSNSIALYICAKEYGYNPILCYGLINFAGHEWYHAWLEIDDIIIDLSIYGNVNYSPYSKFNDRLNTPYIGTYEDSFIHYGKFKFDKDWPLAAIAKKEGLTFEQYMDGLPQNAMWKVVCKYMDVTCTANLIKHLRTHIKNKKIERL